MLKIGITASFFYPDPNRVVFGPKTLSYVENDMMRYICREGVLPVLIPDVDEERLLPILDQLDGFIFPGGTDLAPQSYNEEPIMEGKWKGDPYRDKYELRIMDYAVKNNKPVLAICRGAQLMNVYFGGTLFQDIKEQMPGALQHRDAVKYDRLTHDITFSPGTILDRLYRNEKRPKIITAHHQGIKNLGRNLQILATCPDDGMIEAIGYTGAEEGKVIGVQWHPEFSKTLGSEVISPEPLMDHFLNYVKRNTNR